MKQEFDLIFKIVVLFGVLVLHFTGCGTEPEFERDNKNDPESSGFVPDQPSQLGLSYKIDGNNIILNWRDKSNFEDGYQIFKTVDVAGNTELIGTVPENNSQFTDSSNSFIFPTQYQIYTFKDTSLSNPLIVNVDLGKVIEINAVQIDQSYRVNFSSNAIFHKGYRIKQTVNKTDFIESTIIDDIDSREILIPIQGKGFSEIIEVSPMYVTNIDTTFGAAKYDFVQLSIPDLHNIQLINSESFTFSWDDIFHFEEGYEVQISQSGSTFNYSLPANSTDFTFEENVPLIDDINIKIRAFYDDQFSDWSSSVLNLPLQPASIDSVLTVSKGEIELSITNNDEQQRNFNLYRSINSNDYEFLTTISSEFPVYTDSNLPDEETVYYRLESEYSTEISNITIRFQPMFSTLFTQPGDYRKIYDIEYSESLNSILYLESNSGIESDEMNILNLDTYQVSNFITEYDDVKFIRVNTSGDRLILYNHRWNQEILYLYDSSTQSILDEIYVVGLEYITDIVFFDNESKLLIAAQVEDTSGTNGSLHFEYIYDFTTSQLNEIDVQEGYYFINEEGTELLSLGLDRSTGSIRLQNYTINNGAFIPTHNSVVQVERIPSGRDRFSTSPSLDTLYITNNNGSFMRYNNRTSSSIDEFDERTFAIKYFDQKYIIHQTEGALKIYRIEFGNKELVDAIYHNSQRRFFAFDFIFLPKKNLIIDAQSNYGDDIYLESNIRVFNIDTKWVIISRN
jgi:hypothetical protein